MNRRNFLRAWGVRRFSLIASPFLERTWTIL
jgi:hypothetical protein